MGGQKPHHNRPLATSGGGNDSDGDFNDYYDEGRYADYTCMMAMTATILDVTGSTTGGGNNPTDGGMIPSWKLKRKA